MKKRDIFLGSFLIVCSLSAYIFLMQMQTEEQALPSPLTVEQHEDNGSMTSSDVGVFKLLVDTVIDLLPAS